MKSMLKKLRKLGDDELFSISDAVDAEIARRQETEADVPETARQRANERGQSYRHRTGAGAEAALVVGVQRVADRKKQSPRKLGKRHAA